MTKPKTAHCEYPCPCGCFGSLLQPKHISGPLMDCIDIHIQVPEVDYDKLTDHHMGEPAN
jgi:magnesium chelatase family protein